MSLTLLASNNASTVLASSINASATTLTVNTGAGSLFPSPVAGTSFFKLTLIDAATGQLTEIVHVTARTGDVMTIERAQEGTAARVWSANDIAANMMTAGTLSYILGNFQPLDATLTALAGLTGAADKLAYFNGADTAALTALTGVGRDIIGKSSIADVLTYLQLRESFSGVVGQSRNARMNIASASASATFTADELIVETATGQQYRLSAFNKTINLGTTGAGGMDVGTVPATGFVAVYAIYNPTTAVSALLAVNATSAVAPEIYSGGNMPEGFTASALVSVWRVSSSQFVVGIQRNRKITFVPYLVLASSISAAAFTSLDVSGCVPRNAQSVDGNANPNITGTGYNTNIGVASLAEGVGAKNIGCGGAALSASFSDLQLVTSQTIYYTLTASTSLQTSYIYITGYEI